MIRAFHALALFIVAGIWCPQVVAQQADKFGFESFKCDDGTRLGLQRQSREIYVRDRSAGCNEHYVDGRAGPLNEVLSGCVNVMKALELDGLTPARTSVAISGDTVTVSLETAARMAGYNRHRFSMTLNLKGGVSSNSIGWRTICRPWDPDWRKNAPVYSADGCNQLCIEQEGRQCGIATNSCFDSCGQDQNCRRRCTPPRNCLAAKKTLCCDRPPYGSRSLPNLTR